MPVLFLLPSLLSKISLFFVGPMFFFLAQRESTSGIGFSVGSLWEKLPRVDHRVNPALKPSVHHLEQCRCIVISFAGRDRPLLRPFFQKKLCGSPYQG